MKNAFKGAGPAFGNNFFSFSPHFSFFYLKMGQKKEKHEKNVKKYIVNSQGGAKHLSPTQNIQHWVLCIDLACFKEKNKD